MSKYLSDFERIWKTLIAFDKKSIPLCAAETPMSPFSKVALDSNLQEKYIMGGVRSFGRENNFVEAKYLFQISSKTPEIKKKIRNSIFTLFLGRVNQRFFLLLYPDIHFLPHGKLPYRLLPHTAD